jgi:hypothetical protein
MKISKTLFTTALLLIICANLIVSHKTHKSHHKKAHKSHKNISHSHNKNYDPKMSPFIIKDYLKLNFDTKKDTKHLLTTCLNLISDSHKLDSARKTFFAVLENFATNEKSVLDASKLKEFLNSVDVEALIDGDSAQKVSCSNIAVSCLKPESVLNGAEHLAKVKSYLQNSMGIYSEGIEKKNNKLITSFASYQRDSDLRSPSLFKKLNSRD